MSSSGNPIMRPFSAMKKSRSLYGTNFYYYWCQENKCVWDWRRAEISTSAGRG